MEGAKNYDLVQFTEFLMEKSHLNIPNLANRLGLHKTTLYSWQKGTVQGIPLTRILYLKPKFEELGVKIGNVTNDTIEVLPEGSSSTAASSQAESKDVYPGTQPYTRISPIPDSQFPLVTPLSTSRKVCTCGQEEYIRKIELEVINLVNENMYLKAKLYEKNENEKSENQKG